jgi:hypothetical protein
MSQHTDTHGGLVMAAAVLLSAAILSGGPAAAPARCRAEADGPSACDAIRRAVDDSIRIRPGMMRKDVEKYFRDDGGMQFPPKARYLWRPCMYLKLDVEYDLSPSRGKNLTSPEDTVRTVSKLYVELPYTD